MITGLVIAGTATLGLIRLGPTSGIGPLVELRRPGRGDRLCLTPMTAVAMSATGAAQAGMVSAVHNAFRQVGQVFGVSVLGALVYAGLPGGTAGPALDAAQGTIYVTGLHHALWLAGLALLAAAALAAVLFAPAGRR